MFVIKTNYILKSSKMYCSIFIPDLIHILLNNEVDVKHSLLV